MLRQKQDSTTSPKAEVRKIVKVGDSAYFSLPPEFLKAHNLKPGDSLPIAYDGILVVTPIPGIKKQGEELEELEIEYTQVIERKDRILMPVTDDPVKSFLDGFDLFHEQIRSKYPDYMISHVDVMTVSVAKQKYYQPSRVVIQRIREIVSPIEEREDE